MSHLAIFRLYIVACTARFLQSFSCSMNNVQPSDCLADPLHLDDPVVAEKSIDAEDDASCECDCEFEQSAADRSVNSPYFESYLSLESARNAVARLEKNLDAARLRLRRCHLMKTEMDAVNQRIHRSIAASHPTRVERVQELTRILCDNAARRALLAEDTMDADCAVDDIADRLALARLAHEQLCLLAKIAALDE